MMIEIKADGLAEGPDGLNQVFIGFLTVVVVLADSTFNCGSKRAGSNPVGHPTFCERPAPSGSCDKDGTCMLAFG